MSGLGEALLVGVIVSVFALMLSPFLERLKVSAALRCLRETRISLAHRLPAIEHALGTLGTDERDNLATTLARFESSLRAAQLETADAFRYSSVTANCTRLAKS